MSILILLALAASALGVTRSWLDEDALLAPRNRCPNDCSGNGACKSGG